MAPVLLKKPLSVLLCTVPEEDEGADQTTVVTVIVLPLEMERNAKDEKDEL